MPETRGRRIWWAITGAVVLAAAALSVTWLMGGGDEDGEDGGGAASSTTAPAASTTSPSTTSPADETAMWPFAGSSTRYGQPEEAARSFAIEFLRFENPVVGAFQQGDSRSGEVPIKPRSTGPTTTIFVRQLGTGGDWSVLGSASENIQVSSPDAMHEIASPVRVTGRAVAFEGNVAVEIRADGSLGAIGAGFVTGGGDELRPFEGDISFETAPAPLGAIVFFTESAENGQVWEATAVRVRLRSTDADAAACGEFRSRHVTPSSGEMEVKAYFTCDRPTGSDEVAVRPVYRAVPSSPRVLEAAMKALLAGPNASERAGGLSSWFSADTADMLRSVKIENRHAVIDFDDLRDAIPNASASAGSARLLAELDATAFQFSSVESVEYRLEGDCEAFNEWLQFGGCEPRTRGTSAD